MKILVIGLGYVGTANAVLLSQQNEVICYDLNSDRINLINDKKFSMATKMDVLNWNAKSSLDSLNLICKELHKGLDGISKTWSEVAINITSTF